jgi:hypothetical protein
LLLLDHQLLLLCGDKLMLGSELLLLLSCQCPLPSQLPRVQHPLLGQLLRKAAQGCGLTGGVFGSTALQQL